MIHRTKKLLRRKNRYLHAAIFSKQRRWQPLGSRPVVDLVPLGDCRGTPVKIGYVSPKTGKLSAFAEADESVNRRSAKAIS